VSIQEDILNSLKTAPARFGDLFLDTGLANGEFCKSTRRIFPYTSKKSIAVRVSCTRMRSEECSTSPRTTSRLEST